MNTPRPRLSAFATHEVLCSWIESAKNQDHLDCVKQYIENIFRKNFPPEENEIHAEFIQNMEIKMNAKDLNPDVLTSNHQMD